MKRWEVILSKQAVKDIKNFAAAGLKPKAEKLLNLLADNPFQNPPDYEKLNGDLDGLYSRRINRQHRLVYQVFKAEKIVKIMRMWTHYE